LVACLGGDAPQNCQFGNLDQLKLRIFRSARWEEATKGDSEKGRFTEEQIIGILKQHEAGRKVPELAREIGMSAAAIYTWKSKYGGMDVSDAQKLKGLEDENRCLKHLVADLSVDKEVLKAVIQKNGWGLPV
jgi:putative transposase